MIYNQLLRSKLYLYSRARAADNINLYYHLTHYTTNKDLINFISNNGINSAIYLEFSCSQMASLNITVTATFNNTLFTYDLLNNKFNYLISHNYICIIKYKVIKYKVDRISA